MELFNIMRRVNPAAKASWHPETGRFWDWSDGSPDGFENVPADLALAYAASVWAYRCIKIRSTTVAGVPIVLKDGEDAEIDDHPLLDLLADVNPDTMNMSDLLRATEGAYNIWGSAYWHMDRDGFNPPDAIYWLNPQSIEVKAGKQGITGFVQTLGSEKVIYSPEEIVYFREFNPLNDLGGLAPLSVALRAVNADVNAEQFVAQFFKHDARPAGLLSSDQRVPDAEIERARSWWERLFGGADKKWKTGIVGGGLKWQSITAVPKDLAMKELREEERMAICAVFGVPPVLAGAWEAANYATALEAKESFYEDTIIPQLQYYAELLSWSVIPFYPDLVSRGAYIDHDLSDIAALREDINDRVSRYMMLYEGGVLTRDEVRTELGYAEIDEGESVFYSSNPEPPGGKEDIPIPPQFGSLNPGVPAGDPSSEVAQATNKDDNNANKALLSELDAWQKFTLRRHSGKIKTERAFNPEYTPPELAEYINNAIEQVKTADQIRAVFNYARMKAATIEPLRAKDDPFVYMPIADLSEEDLEQELAKWQEDYKGTKWELLLEAEHTDDDAL